MSSIIHEENSDTLFERKVLDVTEGLDPEFFNRLHNRVGSFNAMVISKYILSMKDETNLSDYYRRDIIVILTKLSLFFGNQKSFASIVRKDILQFLDSFRKPEIADPTHRWIGIYNIYRIHLMRFFKWLYYPNIEPNQRPKPSIIENIPRLRRKEVSIYKPSDLWTEQDDFLFLKYCSSKRIKCYHAVSRDTSCRPHEILKMMIKDISFKTSGDHQYTEVLVNGKTGSRHIHFINSIPYVKDYLDHEHPQPGNPNAPFICGMNKSFGRAMREASLLRLYDDYKKEYFPKLLDNPNVPPVDKQKIRELLKKP
jgi:integrase